MRTASYLLAVLLAAGAPASAQTGTPVRGMEFAAAVNLLQKDVKVEGLLLLPQNVRRVRAVTVAIGWGLGFDFYDDPQIRRVLQATESGLLLARTTNISTQPQGFGGLNDAALGGADALLLLLQRLARESGHPELTDAPLLFWGQSRGGGFGPTFAVLHPLRTIAVVGYQSSAGLPTLKVLSEIPVLLIAGARDTPVPAASVQDLWKRGRSLGAPWTFAVQPDATHGDDESLKKSEDLTIPWIAAVLRQRLSPDGPTLRAVTDASGWLGNVRTGEVAPYDTFAGSKLEASWLPDETCARGWRTVTGTEK